MASLYWYDLETFGKHPHYDRIAQFAGLRTDEEFNPVGEPLVLYNRICPDYLPDPTACLITGITPQETLEKGLREIEFTRRILEAFMVPGTCVAGFNSINFDDECIRNLLYRNFHDPYEREYAQGNSRWDIIDLLRACHDLRPEGIEWLYREDGRPVFKLELLTRANGIAHEHAHDALSDVRATVAMAKLVFQKQPKLFSWFFGLRKKDAVFEQIDLYKHTPVLHTSGYYTSPQGCTTLVAPLALDPGNGNCILAWDLRNDPSEIVNLSVDELRKRLFTPADEQSDGPRVRISQIHANKSPAVSPVSLLDEATERRLGIDRELCRKHFRMLGQEKLLIQKITELFSRRSYNDYKDPDLQIYSGGFFKDADRKAFASVHACNPANLLALNPPFEDPRLPQMLWRFTARNYPEQLDEAGLKRWKSFCASRILLPPHEGACRLSDYRKKIEAARGDRTLEGQQLATVAALDEYGKFLEKNVLQYS